MANLFCSSCGTEYRRIGQEYCAMCGAPSDSQKANEPEVFAPQFHEFTPSAIADFAEGVFSFHNANLDIVIGSSERWFPGEYVPAEKIAKKVDGGIPQWSAEWSVNQNFTDGEEFFDGYESILWEDSKFGQRFISLLEAAGAHVSHGYYGRTVEFDNPAGGKEVVALSTPIDLYSGIWALSDGSRFIQKGQVFKSKRDGHEIVYWNIDALINSRASLGPVSKSASHLLHIPHLLQVATYLAETPFPSPLSGSLGIFRRENTFGEGNSNPPRPATRFQKDGIAWSLVTTNGQNQAIGLWAPELYQHGYIFTDSMSDEEISLAIPGVCDGLPKIMEILVDGYANWPADSDLNFQLSLGSGSSQCEDGKFYKYGLYIPGQIYGPLCARSYDRYNEIYEIQEELERKGNVEEFLEGLSEYKFLSDFGIGSIICHSANTYAVGATAGLLEETPEELLQYFIDIDVDSQAMNALSNLMIFYIQRKDFKAADRYIDRALALTERPGPNLEILSHFQSWDGAMEVEITLEILESALTVKENLRDKKGLRSVAEYALEYCGKKAPGSELVQRAEKLLK